MRIRAVSIHELEDRWKSERFERGDRFHARGAIADVPRSVLRAPFSIPIARFKLRGPGIFKFALP